MKLFISNGFIVDPASNREEVGTLVIENGIITEIITNKEDLLKLEHWKDKESVQWIDAEGMWVVPGFIDLHVHLREPGFEYKEDIESGCLAASKGGITTICCMPNTNPTIDGDEIVTFIHNRARRANGVQVFVIGAITNGQEGKELADYQGMINSKTIAETQDRGICAISEDGKTVGDIVLMLEAMREAKRLNIPIFSHAEPEVEIVERDLNLAKITGCRLHFCHISKKESVNLIREAKKINHNITAETAPHYFTIDESMVENNPNKKMNPPLGQKEDVSAILEGLKDGTLDVIATDHAPHHPSEKELPFDEAPFGVIGLETSFAVSYTALVKTGILKPIELIRKMSTKPAEIIKIDRGSLQVGKMADISIIDVNKEYEIESTTFVSKGKNSAFIGHKVYGKTVYTLIRGTVVWKEEKND